MYKQFLSIGEQNPNLLDEIYDIDNEKAVYLKIKGVDIEEPTVILDDTLDENDGEKDERMMALDLRNRTE